LRYAIPPPRKGDSTRGVKCIQDKFPLLTFDVGVAEVINNFKSDCCLRRKHDNL